ncbi:hypothetical protein NPJ88_018915, partial [Halomonas elongata]|nr:hypothetical protein [Halomonas elongata]
MMVPPVGLLLTSLALFTLGALFLRASSLWLRLPVVALATSLAFLCSAYVLADHFTGQGIDESVFYHLLVGLQGAGFREYSGEILLAGLLVVLCLAYGTVVFHLMRRRVAKCSRLTQWCALPLLLLAWFVNPAVGDLATVGYQYVLADARSSLPDSFVEPGKLERQEGVESPRNLVLIYAESLERTYLDEDVFGDLMPRIAARESSALSFTDIRQLPGMWWTIGGMV